MRTPNDATAHAPTTMVLIGATGDLAARKIIPALWHLFLEGMLPDRLAVIGVARRPLRDEEFQTVVRGTVEKQAGAEEDAAGIARFLTLFSYSQGAAQDTETFRSLANALAERDAAWGVCANKLLYLAVPPSAYRNIFEHLAAHKLNLPCGGNLGWSRVLIEKPFGADLQSAEELQQLLAAYFKEEQIYRIDHYLFKEIIQGIENFRFSNNLFESTWDKTSIDRIDIRLFESLGVEGRGGFYETMGALRDVGQNHLLTMLAAVTSEYPPLAETAATRTNRANILRTLAPWTRESLRTHTYRAQYEGYQSIAGVRPDSNIETYMALKTELLHPRWRGVPIYLAAGKRMAEARKEIVLTLKHPPHCLLCRVREHEPNRIIFRLEPNDEIVIHFWTKKPGFEHELEERTFSFFLYEKRIKVQYVEEYAKVLHDAMAGRQALFLSREEVEAAWRFTDPIVSTWQKDMVPLETYAPGTTPAPALLRGIPQGTPRGKLKNTHKRASESIGYIGLGKMGCGMVERLLEKDYDVVAFDTDKNAVAAVSAKGARGASSLQELVSTLPHPRTVWIMVPHQRVDTVLHELVPLLQKGDTLIDGGNSPYKESVRRAGELGARGINFLDVGVSGGPTGARRGACLMVGGDRLPYERHERLLRDLSVEGGYGYMGRSGAGHFVKMVHNGIEYGMMQAIGEGFTVMKKSSFSLDLPSIASLYNHGSVIESRLVGWLKEAYEKFGSELDKDECCSGEVGHSGEGEWTVEAARELGVPVAIIEGALEFRKQSEGNPSYTGQVLSAMRHQFGGHDARLRP